MHASDGQATRVAGSALVVALLAGLGLALRAAVADQSLFGDELSTYWVVSTNGLGGVVSTVHTDAEITPPLYFAAAWLTTRIDLTPELLRAPSLLAGTASIPLVYLVGQRTVGRAAGLVGATLTALAPFMIYYSAEARGYALAMAFVLLSTLALLVAVSGGRARWWVVYAGATCAALYSHYTVVFVLGAQLLWLLWAHPEARRAALLANAGAAVAFVPWLSGLLQDLDSPTTDILDALLPFDLHSVRIALQHWSIGYPYAGVPQSGLRDLPGIAALVLLGLGLTLALAGVALGRLRAPARLAPARLHRGLVLIVAIALATPVGEAAASLIGTNLFGTRNLAASWPSFALCLAALLVAAGTRLRLAAVALVIAAFAIGAAKMLEPQYQRPDYEAAARFVDREASAGDVVVDGAAALVTTGPLSGLDVELRRPHRILRIGAPQQRDHPFTFGDPILPVEDVMRRAATAGGERIFVAMGGTPASSPLIAEAIRALPRRYRVVQERSYPGLIRLVVRVYADSGGRL